MKNQAIAFSAVNGSGVQQLSPLDRELLAEATATLPRSYSPYSNFKVAAAARLADGTVVAAANTENAAYPMCRCAESNALAAAEVIRPDMPIVAMAITVKAPDRVLDQPASPCGSCRQLLNEHELRYGHRLRVILRGETGPVRVLESVKELLPFGFGEELRS